MPMYDYKCDDCSIVEEYLLASTDETDLQCVHCGGLSRRQLSAPAGIDVEGGTPKFRRKVRGKRRGS